MMPETLPDAGPDTNAGATGLLSLLSLLSLLFALGACGAKGELSAARQRYNAGVGAIDEKSWDAAIVDLLAARDKAGPDPELRYRAAFNLGVAYAGTAQELEVADPKAALGMLRKAASWFRDATRLRPQDQDPRVNLELSLHRARVLADRLNQGDRGLEAQLDELIEAQRSARDAVRGLLSRIEADGALANPQPFTAELEALAVQERTLTTQASSVLDLAADERSLIEATPEDERAPEQRARAVRLTALEHYLGQGRQALADSRRLLRKLAAERAHLRADAAVRDLKRAREQLADPQQLVRALLADQQLVYRHTRGLAELRKGTLTLGAPDSDEAGKTKPKTAPPPWLTTEHLSARQAWIHERTSELFAGLDAMSKAAETMEPEQLAQAGHQIEVATQAAPLIAEAMAAMQEAGTDLIADALPAATAEQEKALLALAQALERFADLRSLVELAYSTQTQAVELIEADAPDTGHNNDTYKDRDAAEVLDELVASNRDRVARMRSLIAQELDTAKSQISAAEDQAGQQGGSVSDEDRAKLDSAVEKAELAETLRAAAQVELDALTTLLAAKRPVLAEVTTRAKAGLEKLEELRRLYFTLVQHIKQLHADQSESRDQTATAQGTKDDARAIALGPLADRQSQHGEMGNALVEALAAQADQAAAQAQQAQQAGAAADDPQAAQAADQAKRLAEAVPEMQDAVAAIVDASTGTSTARDQAQQISVDLEPILEDQKTAIEHLAKVLELLEPPKDDEQQQDQNKDQDGDQSQEQISRQEAERRLQAIREREAKRRKEQPKGGPPDPVEKDW